MEPGMHCIACDALLEGLRDREEFCQHCNYLIDLIVFNETEVLKGEEFYGIYEDWEYNEKMEEGDDDSEEFPE